MGDQYDLSGDCRGAQVNIKSTILGEGVAAAALPPYTPPDPPDPDTLPDPSDLPPGSRLPFGRNALFTGRVQPLLDLARRLLHDAADAAASAGAQAALVTQVVQGMGGIGKTQLAVEFAYRYGRFFQSVHWISAAVPDLVGAEIAECGRRMVLSPWPPEQPEQVERTLGAWHDERRRLVILDNLEDVQAAREWLPRLQGSGVRLMLTARRADWPGDLGLAPLRLDTFSPGESLQFLRQYLPEERAPDAELVALAERQGHLPLALELAARYIERLPRLSVPGYLGRLDDLFADPAMAGWREELGNPTGHDLDLAGTFRLSWDEVEDEDARRLFLVAGHCAPSQPIPCELLEAALQPGEAGGLGQRIGKLFRKKRPQLNLDQALSTLTGLGLLEIQDPAAGPAIHLLLAETTRSLPGASEALSALTDALATATYEATQTGLPAAFVPLRPHAEAVVPAAEAAGLDGAGTLWNELGVHLETVADYPGARAAFERGLAIDEAVYGPNHPSVARDVNHLGLVLQDLGDLAGARAAFERALAIDEAAYGPDHPSVARDVSNLGSVLKAQGDLARARATFERALDIDEAVYTPDHPSVARDVNSLGLVLQGLGDLAGSRAAFERALAIFERQLGPDHPNVATLVNNLGGVLQAQGNLAGARAAFERALSIWEAFSDPRADIARRWLASLDH